MIAPSSPHLDRPLVDVAAWARHFSQQPIPVLAESAAAVAALAERYAEGFVVDANFIVKFLGHDPLMTLRILSHVALQRGGRHEFQVETITEALGVIGIRPFFSAFSHLSVLHVLLKDQPEALHAAHEVMERGRRAGRFALGFCRYRMGKEERFQGGHHVWGHRWRAAQSQQAAELHDFSELLLWVHAPALALRVRRLQQEQPGLGSAQAQRMVLRIELDELQKDLMRAWRMPGLLISMSDPQQAVHPDVRSVLLAVRLARHLAHGWENPALRGDILEVAELLELSPQQARQLLVRLDS